MTDPQLDTNSASADDANGPPPASQETVGESFERESEQEGVYKSQYEGTPMKKHEAMEEERPRQGSKVVVEPGGKSSDIKMPHHPAARMNAAQDTSRDGGAQAASNETPTHNHFRRGMGYPSPASQPVHHGSYYPHYGGEPPISMRESPMGPTPGSGPDDQQWRHYNPRDHPYYPTSAHASDGYGHVSHTYPPLNGPNSPFDPPPRHHHNTRYIMGSPLGHPDAMGRGGSMHGGYTPDYGSPSKYYETIHNMGGSGVRGTPRGHGGQYGMHHGTMMNNSPYHPGGPNSAMLYRGGGATMNGSSPPGVNIAPHYSPPNHASKEKQKRPYEDMQPRNQNGDDRTAMSVRKEESSQRDVTAEKFSQSPAVDAAATTVETPEKEAKRQRVTKKQDDSMPTSDLRHSETMTTVPEEEVNEVMKASVVSNEASREKMMVPPQSGPSRSYPGHNAGMAKSDVMDRNSFPQNHHERGVYFSDSAAPCYYGENGPMRAGTGGAKSGPPFSSPEGYNAPYGGYGRGGPDAPPGAGYYDPPPSHPSSASHRGYPPYGPPPPHVYPGYGPPPPMSQGYYYEGMNDYYPGPDYDGNMYYNRMYGGPPPPTGPGFHGDPRSHPRTPYGVQYPMESPQKPYVTPDSRTHIYGSGQGPSPPGMASPPEVGLTQQRAGVEEGEYTKLLRSKSARLTDRKKLQNQAWLDRFEELKKYKEEHGDCQVPQKYLPNPSLGTWVNKQRMEYKLLMDGHKSSMTEERLQALASIGFTWAKRKGQATWDAKFEQLKEYKALHGDCLIPTKYSKDLALGRWVSTQREQYRLMTQGDPRSKMTVERAKKLEEVGFVWRLQF